MEDQSKAQYGTINTFQSSSSSSLQIHNCPIGASGANNHHATKPAIRPPCIRRDDTVSTQKMRTHAPVCSRIRAPLHPAAVDNTPLLLLLFGKETAGASGCARPPRGTPWWWCVACGDADLMVWLIRIAPAREHKRPEELQVWMIRVLKLHFSGVRTCFSFFGPCAHHTTRARETQRVLLYRNKRGKQHATTANARGDSS